VALTRKDKAIRPGSLLESGADPATRSRVASPVPVDPEPPAFVLRTFDYNLESKLHAGTSSAPGQPLRGKAV
jgi:hypothetical protein